MHSISVTAETYPLQTNRAVIVCLTIVVLTAAFYGVEHRNDQVSNSETFTNTAEEVVDKLAEGDMVRRIAIPALGLFGVLMLLRRDGSPLDIRSQLGWLLCGFLAWCAASVLWSVDPPMTVRHFVVLVLCTIGAAGVARQVTMRELCLITLVVTTILVMNSVRTEIVLGTFRPLSPQYRFSGTLHPNVQAPYCATMALAAACLASRAKRGRVLLWVLCLTAVVLLLLTKSRTATAAFLVGLLLYVAFDASWPKRLLGGLAIIWAGSTLVWLCLLSGWDIERKIVDVALIGRQEEADSLAGRIPLWSTLMPHVQEHLLLGHGYQTFWNPRRIEKFSQTFQFALSDGHSAYLDMALDLGLIGAGLCLVSIWVGIRLAADRYRASGDIGCSFLFALLACRSVNALMESNFAAPTSFVPFVMICGLAQLAFFHRPDDLFSFADSPRETT